MMVTDEREGSAVMRMLRRCAAGMCAVVFVATAGTAQAGINVRTSQVGVCGGDCDASGGVTIAELVTLVSIALGDTVITSCPVGDTDGNGRIAVHELVAAVVDTLDGCPAPEVCGGIAGIACPAGERCELPEGMCNVADLQGACEAIPDDCLEEIAPVCGCDGVTYTTDCDRRTAEVARAHDGVCPSPLSAEVDALVAAAGVSAETPGGAVMVIQAGRILHWAAYGLADIERRVPNTPHTIFRLASITKSFTALAIMMLAEEGTLAYDDPVALHLPELARLGDAVTIRRLLHHTSGLPDPALHVLLLTRNPMPSNADELALLAEIGDLLFPPGDRFQYGDMAYEILASVVERVSGQSYDDFLQQRVFGPLGMTSTFSRPNAARLEDPDRAQGYDGGGAGFVLADANPLDDLAGAASIYSTVEDLYRYGQALHGGRLVQPATLAEAVTPGRLNDGTEARNDQDESYGFGLILATHDGQPWVGHRGGSPGFRSYLARFIDPQLSVIVLWNQDDITRDLFFGIVDLYLPPPDGSP